MFGGRDGRELLRREVQLRGKLRRPERLSGDVVGEDFVGTGCWCVSGESSENGKDGADSTRLSSDDVRKLTGRVAASSGSNSRCCAGGADSAFRSENSPRGSLADSACLNSSITWRSFSAVRAFASCTKFVPRDCPSLKKAVGEDGASGSSEGGTDTKSPNPGEVGISDLEVGGVAGGDRIRTGATMAAGFLTGNSGGEVDSFGLEEIRSKRELGWALGPPALLVDGEGEFSGRGTRGCIIPLDQSISI